MNLTPFVQFVVFGIALLLVIVTFGVLAQMAIQDDLYRR